MEYEITPETKMVEDLLRVHFERADAYRCNESIRVAVIDPEFSGKTSEERLGKLEEFLERLPEETQGDILTVIAMTAEELEESGYPSCEGCGEAVEVGHSICYSCWSANSLEPNEPIMAIVFVLAMMFVFSCIFAR